MQRLIFTTILGEPLVSSFVLTFKQNKIERGFVYISISNFSITPILIHSFYFHQLVIVILIFYTIG